MINFSLAVSWRRIHQSFSIFKFCSPLARALSPDLFRSRTLCPPLSSFSIFLHALSSPLFLLPLFAPLFLPYPSYQLYPRHSLNREEIIYIWCAANAIEHNQSNHENQSNAMLQSICSNAFSMQQNFRTDRAWVGRRRSFLFPSVWNVECAFSISSNRFVNISAIENVLSIAIRSIYEIVTFAHIFLSEEYHSICWYSVYEHIVCWHLLWKMLEYKMNILFVCNTNCLLF